jgi:DNA-directed RNA polymerase specialized sigma24 family protein
MFAGGTVTPREAMGRLANRLTTIDCLEVRDFAGAAAGHIRATLLEYAWTADREAASDELLEWVRVHGGVDRLPGTNREVFDLLLYWGLSEARVAALLGLSLGEVRVCWNEARLALQEGLGQGRGGGP